MPTAADRQHLHPAVKLEPLVLQWYAWPHLIAPAPAAMNLTGRYLKLLASYLQSPRVHAAAVKNPAFLGGPFVDLGGKHLDEVRALIERTERDCLPLLELAAAIGECDAMLQREAAGAALPPLYRRVPEALRGLVELVYDLNDQPSLRLIEPLLYASPCYDPGLQSVALSVMTGDERPFILSTPRVAANSAGEVHCAIPFSDPALDELARARRAPAIVGDLAERLAVRPEDAAAFRALFTAERPPARAARAYDGPGLRVRYLGHASLLLQTRGASVLVDPMLSYEYPSPVPRLTLYDLPDRLDCVLVTHAHQDHASIEDLLQLRHLANRIVVPRGGGGRLADPDLRLLLRRIGFRGAVALEELDTLELEGGRITALPFFGEHADLDIRSKLTYCVELAGRRVMIAADSTCFDERAYERIARAIGDVDVLFLGMECGGAPLSWLYGPLRTAPIAEEHDETRRVNGADADQAWRMIRALGCKEVYVYAMGQEPWLNHVMALRYTEESKPIVESNKLLELCRRAGIRAERLFGKMEWHLPSPL